jgi:hypothetical protein
MRSSGEASDGGFGQDGDAVGNTVRAGRGAAASGSEAATEGRKGGRSVERPTNAHRTFVESNGTLLGRGRSA